MAGQPNRSGGHNRKPAEVHAIQGTFRPHRHAPKPDPAQTAPVSAADRRRVLKGLAPEARRIAASLLDAFGPWNAAALETLRLYVQSAGRVQTLQDDAERRRETRTMLALLKALDLEAS